MARTRAALALSIVFVWLGCSLDFTAGPRGAPVPAPEGGAPDGAVRDAGVEPLDDPSRWEIFDLGAVPIPGPVAAPLRLGAAAFDGKHLYLLPSLHQAVLRFDTGATFRDPDSWEAAVLPQILDVASAGWCGTDIFFASKDDDIVGQYAPATKFQAANMPLVDLQPADVPVGFAGMACAAKALYLAPASGAAAATRSVDVAAEDSWTRGPAGQFRGAVVFKSPRGPRIVFVPGAGSLVASEFGDTTDWTKGAFDLSTVGMGGAAFDGAVTDGRFVYLVPSAGGRVARFDGSADPRAASSWELGAQIPASPMRAAVFDGRFVYFGPADGTVVTRYDASASFSDPKSFDTYDVRALVDAAALSFGRIAFDGRYVYLVPSNPSRIIARYRTDALGMPSSYAGSFY